MKVLTKPDRFHQFRADFRGGLPAFAIFNCLALSRFVAAHFFGDKWDFITATIAAMVWFAIRPWLLGLMSEKSRLEIKRVGGVYMCGAILQAAQNYWRFWP